MPKVQSPSGLDPTSEDIGPAWLEQLAALGGTAVLRGTRLAVQPGSVFRLLSPEMLEVWCTHRAEIKAALHCGWQPVLWTSDYRRRITAADVAAACGDGHTLNPRAAYERARVWLDEQDQRRRDREMLSLIGRRNAR